MTPVEEEAARQRARLQAIEEAQTREITRSYTQVAQRLVSNLRALTDLIEQETARGVEVRPVWLFAQDRYRILISDLQAHTERFLSDAATAVTEGQREAVNRAFADGQRLAKLALGPAPENIILRVTTTWNRLPAPALDAFIGRAQDGAALGDFLTELAPLSPRKVKDTLAFGVAAGKNPRVIAREVQQAAQITPQRALVIARTEIVQAHRQAVTETWKGTGVVQTWTWRCARDRRVCPACWAMDGTEHPADEEMGSHPQCFPAGTIVAGPEAVAATARHYDGEIVVIRFASGDELAVTPNHPVLTTGGWVPAGQLDELSDVVRSRRQEGPPSAVDPDNDERPTVIEDVAEALGSAGRVTSARVPAAAEHFHGDGLGGEVDVVRADRPLRDRLDSALMEPLGEDPFGLRIMTAAPLASLGDTDQVLDRLGHAPDGSMCGLYVPEMLFARAPQRHQGVGVGVTAERDSGLDEVSTNDTAVDAEALGDGVLTLAGGVARGDLGDREVVTGRSSSELGGFQRRALGGGSPDVTLTQDPAQAALADPVPSGADLNRFAGEVVADRVVEVLVRRFVGHVYNLETVDGWYTANDTVVHNCRCARIPKTQSWADLGFPGVPDRRPAPSPASQAFDALTEADKLAVLGRAKFDAYNNGDITLRDLVKPTRSERWGSGIRTATLQEMAR